MIRLTDKTFRYTPSFDTNLKKKFALLVRRQRAAARSREAGAPQERSVLPLLARRAGAKT